MFNRMGAGMGGGMGQTMGRAPMGQPQQQPMGQPMGGFDMSRMPQQAVQNAQGVPFTGQMPGMQGGMPQMPQQAFGGQMPQQAFGGQMPQFPQQMPQQANPFGQQMGRAGFMPQQMPQQSFGGFPGGLLGMFGR